MSEENPITASDVFDHLLLSALWGASFLFMRIAAPEFGPTVLIGLRCAIGAITLVIILGFACGLKGLNQKRWQGMAIGVINSAIPFVLIAFASLTISSGVLSIVNALAPFWGAFIGWLWLRSTLTSWQIVGLVIGFFGVALLILSGPRSVSVENMAGLWAMLAGLLSTVFYGFAANFAKKYLVNTQPLVNATNSQIGAALVLVVPSVLLWPSEPISLTAWVSLIALGVLSTGYAYVLYFRLIDRIGASRAITVVFVVPLFGVAFGWLFLKESISASMIAAGFVIALGSALSLKLLPRRSVNH